MDNKKENKKRQNCFYTIFNGRSGNKYPLKNLNASYTIEAAVIVPMTFIIIVAMIFLSFYLKDTVTLFSVSYKTAIEYADDTEKTENIIKEKLEKTMLVIKDYSIEYQSKNDSESITIYYKYKIPFVYLNKVLDMISKEKKIEIDVKNLRGRDDILKQKIAKELINTED